MSRPIDADKLKEYFFRPYSNEETYSNIDIAKIIDEQPTIFPTIFLEDDDDDDYDDGYEYCDECRGYGDDYGLDENGDLVCNCDTCFNNPDRIDYD